VQQSVVRSWARPPWVQQLEALKTDMLPSQRMRLRARTVAGNVVGSSQNKTFDPPSFGIHVQPGMWDSTDDVPLVHIPSIKMFAALSTLDRLACGVRANPSKGLAPVSTVCHVGSRQVKIAVAALRVAT